MRGWAWSGLREVLPALAVLLVSLVVLYQAATLTRAFPSERDFLRRAPYFGYLFLERDLTRAEWDNRYDTHTQPMLVNYILGGWLWLRGYDIYHLTSSDLDDVLENNRRIGQAEHGARLAEIRAPMIAIGATAITLLYFLGRMLGGIVAGLVAAALTVLSPVAQESLVRAKGESTLALFVVLALLLAIAGARRGRGVVLPVGWAIGLGLALGLGVQAKLTAVISLAAIAAWGFVATVQTWSTGRARPRALWRAGRGWALALLVGLAAFVASNPHLYPNPVAHTLHLFTERAETIAGGDQKDGKVVPGLAVRSTYVVRISLVDGMFAGSNGLPLEAALAAAGLAVLLVRVARGWREAGTLPTAEALTLVLVLAYFAGLSANMYSLEPRYCVPSLVLSALLAGIGTATLGQQILAALGSGRPATLPNTTRA